MLTKKINNTIHIIELAKINEPRRFWDVSEIKKIGNKIEVINGKVIFSFNENTKNFSYKINGVTYNVAYQFDLFQYLVKIGYLKFN